MQAGVLFGAVLSPGLCLTFGSPLSGPVAAGAAKTGIRRPIAGPWVPRPAFGSELIPATTIAIVAATPTTQV